MQLDLSLEEARFLKEHLTSHIAQVDNELVHTDKREMQRLLADDVDHLRRIERRLADLLQSATTPGGG